ncbi:MAG: hypothetical protein HY695_38705, partial [Deltaproteobacteria bacterium]|nr:hypothetical protein [Deltaproteobacteria bacterium]
MKVLDRHGLRMALVFSTALYGIWLASAVLAAEAERAYTAADVKITDAQRKAAETFYRDKTIEWVSYTNPGSGTETMLRIMMKYLPKYIPGNPRMGSVQFM